MSSRAAQREQVKPNMPCAFFLFSEDYMGERQQKRDKYAQGGESLQNRVKRVRVIGSKAIEKNPNKNWWVAAVQLRNGQIWDRL